MSLTKKYMYLPFLSIYLAYALNCRIFMHNGDGVLLPLYLYSI